MKALLAKLDKCEARAIESVQQRLLNERHVGTLSPSYNKSITALQGHFATVKSPAPGTYPVYSTQVDGLSADFSQICNQDKTVVDMALSMLVYYSIVEQRFIDGVMQELERHFKTNIANNAMEWLRELAHDSGRLLALMSEDPIVAQQRTNCEVSIQNLEAARQILTKV